MREIKFRAWDKHQKEMLEVGEIQFGVRHGMAPSDRANYVGTPYGSRYYVEGEEVVLIQYTGLKDKNGREIYEGDIMKIEGATAKVVFWEKPPEFGLDFYHNKNAWCEDWNLSDDSTRMEIVGNVYEHPELLNRNEE